MESPCRVVVAFYRRCEHRQQPECEQQAAYQNGMDARGGPRVSPVLLRLPAEIGMG